MPRLDLTAGTPVVLYQAIHGTTERKTRFIARTASGDTAVLWVGRTPGVTVGGTDTGTDGVPVYSTEPFEDDMITGDIWYVVADADTSVYYEVIGTD